LFIPDSGDKQRQFSITIPILFGITFLITCLIIGCAIIVINHGFLLASKKDVEKKYSELLSERLAVRTLLNDLNRMKFLDDKIRKTLKGDLELQPESNTGTDKNDSLQPNSIGGFNISSIPSQVPVSGYLTQKLNIGSYSKSKNHYGIDISAIQGTPIVAVAGGFVVHSGWSYDLGNHIILYHGDGYFTQYGHTENVITNTRDIVSAGEVIAHVGSTGISSGPHLHFEIWKDGMVLDPLQFFPQYKLKDLSISSED